MGWGARREIAAGDRGIGVSGAPGGDERPGDGAGGGRLAEDAAVDVEEAYMGRGPVEDVVGASRGSGHFRRQVLF
jgi:hypothetical protein